MIATTVVAKVEAGRLQKAVEGLVSSAYTITVASQSVTEIRGFVVNGDGKEYGVVISKEDAFCSCKDAMYRKGICKHAVVLALYTIRNPKRDDGNRNSSGTGSAVIQFETRQSAERIRLLGVEKRACVTDPPQAPSMAKEPKNNPVTVAHTTTVGGAS